MTHSRYRMLFEAFGSFAIIALLMLIMAGCSQNTAPPTSAVSVSPMQTSPVIPAQSGKASFKVKSLDLAPSEVTAGQTSTATVIVENTGAIEGSYSVSLRVNGGSPETKDLVLTPGSTRSASFSIRPTVPGTYEITVERVSASLLVKQTIASATPLPTGATTSPPPPTSTGAVLVTFDPNPIPVVSGQVSFRFTLNETKGVGVTFKTCVWERYLASGQSAGTITPNDPTRFFATPGNYLVPNGSVFSNARFGGQSGGCVTVTLTGVDDNGQQITVTGRASIS
jgi:hypothetical protein